MLRVSNLSKWFGETPIARDVSFVLSPGTRAGIVGPNGSGKTTLLRIIAGLEPREGGSISLGPAERLGYLRQGFLGDEARPMAELLRAETPILEAHLALEAAGEALAASAEELDRYQRAADSFENLGGYQELTRVEEVLRHLDLLELDPARPTGSLSGGQKTRLALAALLIGAPEILLLDEPTNHLDVDALRWLEEFVRGYRGTVLLVSHDRAFLDATVDTILELDPATHGLTAYPGGYSAYAAAKKAEREAEQARYLRVNRERERVEADIRRTMGQARGVEAMNSADFDHGDTRHAKDAARTRATKVARKATVRARKLEKFLVEHPMEKPTAGWGLNVRFASVAGGAREVLRVEGLRKRYGGHAVLDGLDLQLRHGERVAITGPNGGGKSTLLEIVAGVLAPDAGTVRLGAGVVVGYAGQEQEGLDPSQTPLACIRAASAMTETAARALLHAYLFSGEEVFRPIGALSYGERTRLALARLVVSGATLLLLDEPTNHLDIAARERLEAALAGFQGTILAVLHDRYAMARLATRTLELREGRLRPLETALGMEA